MAIRSASIATRKCSAKEIMRQIGPMTLGSCGAREFVDLGDGLRFKVGLGQRRMQIIIKLAADDTYVVERIRLPRGKFEYVSEAWAEDIYAENLPGVVRRLGDV